MTAASDACAQHAVQALDAAAATELAALFKAVADPLRIRILSAISNDPRDETCVCDLAGLADVTQPTLSHHLRVLKDAGLLEAERRGTWVWYRLAPKRREAIAAMLGVLKCDAPSAQGGEGRTEGRAG